MQEVNLETGYICGIMRAENVPQAKTPVVTFWEGDIIDNVNHSFMTSKWGAEKKVDAKHWLKFDGFGPLSHSAQAFGGRYSHWMHFIGWQFAAWGSLVLQMIALSYLKRSRHPLTTS